MAESPVPQETGLPKITVCPFMSCRATQFEYDRDPCQRAVCGMRDALAVPVSVEAGGEVETSYMRITDHPAGDPNIDVAYTPEVAPGLLVDIDPYGHVIGIERIGGQVDAGVLASVIRWMVAAPRDAQLLPSDSQAGQTDTDEGCPLNVAAAVRLLVKDDDEYALDRSFSEICDSVWRAALAWERARTADEIERATRHGFEMGERNIKLVAENAELESLVGEIVGHIADHQHPAYQAYLRYVRKEEAGRG